MLLSDTGQGDPLWKVHSGSFHTLEKVTVFLPFSLQVTGGKRVILGNFPPIFAGGQKASGPFFFGKQTIHICIVMVRIFPHSSALFGLVSYHDP